MWSTSKGRAKGSAPAPLKRPVKACWNTIGPTRIGPKYMVSFCWHKLHKHCTEGLGLRHSRMLMYNLNIIGANNCSLYLTDKTRNILMQGQRKLFQKKAEAAQDTTQDLIDKACYHCKKSASSLCSFCEHATCGGCNRTCESCDKMFCSLCSTVKYVFLSRVNIIIRLLFTHSMVHFIFSYDMSQERTFCISCNDEMRMSHSVSASGSSSIAR